MDAKARPAEHEQRAEAETALTALHYDAADLLAWNWSVEPERTGMAA
jgi:hypothetical protein